MIPILFWEASDNWEDILRRMIARKEIDLRVWVGTNPRCTFQVHSFDYGDFPDYVYEGYSKDIYDKVYPCLYRFINMYSRNYRPDRQYAYACKTVHDFVDIFSQLLEVFAQILIKSEVKLVAYSRMFHLGADYLMYETAKALGIKTVLLYQSLFPNRFFYFFDENDFGTFKNVKPVSPPPDYFKLPETGRHEWFFMKKAKKTIVENFVPFSFESEDAVKRRFPYVHVEDYAVEKTHAAHMNARQRAFFAKFHETITNDADLDAKFVYFPLHHQPEMSTSSQGGEFCDQLLALERLRLKLPDDWMIYVKDKPIQTFFQRGSWYFDRLKRIRGVKLVPNEFDTIELIRKSKIVATITGTAGYEALLEGTPCIYFGNAWFANITGAFKMSDDLDVPGLAEFPLDRRQIEKDLNDVLALTAEGVTYYSYRQMVPGFDETYNTVVVAVALASIMRQALDHSA